MPTAASILIAALLAIAPVAETKLDIDVEGLDPEALEAGLRVRVGGALDHWAIKVEREAPDRYRVELRQLGKRPATVDRRLVTLEGPSDADRSRELAVTLALIIEASDQLGSEPPDKREPLKPLGLPIGLLVVEGHVGLGPPRQLDPDFGLGLGGGLWLLSDHLQPRARVGWSHSRAGPIELHQVNAGLGLAGGAPLGRLWFGALLMPALKWTYARQISASSGWFGGGEISLLAQYRGQHAVLGLRTGVETTFPAVRVPGTHEVVRWGHLRWVCAFEVGISVRSSWARR